MNGSAEASNTENNIEDKLLELAQTKPNGLTNKDIQCELPDVPPTVWTTVVNKFLKAG